MYWFFLADFVFTSECPHYSRILFSSFISTCTTSAKNSFAFNRTLDCFPNNITLVIKKFYLYLIQLWWSFFDIIVKCDVVNSQTCAVLPLKNPVEPPLLNAPMIESFSQTFRGYCPFFSGKCNANANWRCIFHWRRGSSPDMYGKIIGAFNIYILTFLWTNYMRYTATRNFTFRLKTDWEVTH